jgi:two-component system, NtrC family, response regulator HydG
MSSAAVEWNPKNDCQLEILIADDRATSRTPLAEMLSGCGYRVETAPIGEQMNALAAARAFDVAILDLSTAFADGLALVRHLRRITPDTDVILLSANASIEEAVAITKANAIYVGKPFSNEALLRTIAEIAERRRQRALLDRELEPGEPGQPMLVGRSPALVQLKHHLEVIARSEGTVLICGESGTGKELVARLIHHASARRGKPLMTVNCAAFPETLLEAELYGHERGAFTGASSRREGRFEAAAGGTIFLDEIGEMPLLAQAKLLRVLEDGTFQRLGSNVTLKPDVRVVAATNKDLEQLVTQGRFREDLLYRLKLFRLVTPPLRDRAGDLPLLVEHFCRKYSAPGNPTQGVSPAAWAVLSHYQFPGNLRELEHALRHAIAFASGQEIQVEHLPDEITRAAAATPGVPAPTLMAGTPLAMPSSEPMHVGPLDEALVEFERDYVMRALAHTGGNRSMAANLLGISRKALWAKLKRYPAPRPKLSMVRS